MAEFEHLFDLHGKTAIVVGAASGIGAASARGLAAFGADVVCVDRDRQSVEAVIRKIESDGGSASSYVTDILDQDQNDMLVDDYGGSDILVITPAMLVRKTLADTSLDEFDQQMTLNVRATFAVVKGFGAQMARQGRGSIVGFSSVRSSMVEPASGVYAATKAAVRQLFRTLAAEVGPSGVRVNLIAPSPVATPINADVRSRSDWRDVVSERSMLRRWAEPEDFVGPLLLLVSDAGRFVTAADFPVDGGWTASDGLARVDDSEKR